MKFNKAGEEGTDVVRYSLSDEGRTFSAVERLRTAERSYDNIWVFDKG